jgi:hypothetical protein
MNTASPALAGVIEALGRKNVRSISSELFSWLKRQQRFGHEKPLELKQQYTWCQELPLMLEQWPALSELFVVDSGRCDFVDGVSIEQRDQVRTAVSERYQPVLRR